MITNEMSVFMILVSSLLRQQHPPHPLPGALLVLSGYSTKVENSP